MERKRERNKSHKSFGLREVKKIQTEKECGPERERERERERSGESVRERRQQRKCGRAREREKDERERERINVVENADGREMSE